MGFLKSKRPILAPAGLQIGSGGSTFTGKIVSSTGIYLSSSTHQVAAGAAQSLGNKTVNFVTVGTSGAGRDFTIPNPTARGQLKVIFVDNQSTSVDTHIVTAATANTFWGTTFNDASLAAASTGSPGGTPAGTVALVLVAASTTQWALLPGSTFNWDFTATTGATG